MSVDAASLRERDLLWDTQVRGLKEENRYLAQRVERLEREVLEQLHAENTRLKAALSSKEAATESAHSKPDTTSDCAHLSTGNSFLKAAVKEMSGNSRAGFKAHLSSSEKAEAHSESSLSGAWDKLKCFCESFAAEKCVEYMLALPCDLQRELVNWPNPSQHKQTVAHLTCLGAHPNALLLAFLLHCFPQIDTSLLSKSSKSALDYAVFSGSDECISLLTKHAQREKQRQGVDSSVEKWRAALETDDSICRQFAEYCTLQPHSAFGETVQCTMQSALCDLIEETKSLPSDALRFVWNHLCQNECQLTSDLWRAVCAKIREVLSAENRENTTLWYWFDRNIRDSALWLDASSGPLLHQMVREQLLSERSLALRSLVQITADSGKYVLRKLAEANADFLFLARDKTAALRQDKLEYGLRAQLSEAETHFVWLCAKDPWLESSRMYDFDCFLTELLFCAHLLKHEFGQCVDAYLGQWCLRGDFKVRKPSVRSKEECICEAQRIASELTASGKSLEYPLSGYVCDVLSCDVVCDTLEAMVECLDSLLKGSGVASKSALKLAPLRVDNEMAEWSADSAKISKLKGTEKCTVYCRVNGESPVGFALVCAVRFWLRPLLDFARSGRRLSSVLKREAQLCSAQQQSGGFSERVKMAGANASKLAPVLCDESGRLTAEVLLSRDAYGKNLIGRVLRSESLYCDTIRGILKRVPRNVVYSVWESKADTGRAPFMLLAQYQSLAVLRTVMDAMPPAIERTVWRSKTKSGWTPLLLGARYRDSAVLCELITRMPHSIADSLWRDTNNSGDTVLHLTCQNRTEDCLQCLRTLLKHMPKTVQRALVNKGNRSNATPVFSALASHVNVAILHCLLSHFDDGVVDISIANKKGETAMDKAEAIKDESRRMRSIQLLTDYRKQHCHAQATDSAAAKSQDTDTKDDR